MPGRAERSSGGRAAEASPRRIAAALRRLVRSRDVDEAARFREAAARHEAGARAAGLDPRVTAGAEALGEWAQRLRGLSGMPEADAPDRRGLVRGGRGARARFRNGAPGNAADARRQEGRAANRDVPAGLRGSPVRGRPWQGRTCRSARRNRTPGPRRPGCFAGRGSECSATGRARGSTTRSGSALRVSRPTARGFARRWTGSQRQHCNAARRGSWRSPGP